MGLSVQKEKRGYESTLNKESPYTFYLLTCVSMVQKDARKFQRILPQRHTTRPSTHKGDGASH
ncbi:hypothetical protein CR513_03605, partial [Mucuna pruriens]